jgi:hypothetical protein
VRQRVGGVSELVHVEGAGFPGDALGQILVVVGVALAHVGAGHHHFRAQRREVEHLLPAHLVWDDEREAVSHARRHQRQPQAGVAGGGLDEVPALAAEPAIALGGGDHRHGDAVLDRSTRILVLELEPQLAGPGVEPGDLHDRCLAHQPQGGLGDGAHRLSITGLRGCRSGGPGSP